MKLKLILLSAATVLASLFASANTTPGTGEEGNHKSDISGSVFHGDSRKPLRDVQVTAYSTGKKEKVVVTDNNGNYAFEDLKPGVYKFVFERDGYKKVTREKVTIKSDEGFQLNIGLNEEDDFNWVPGTFNFSSGGR